MSSETQAPVAPQAPASALEVNSTPVVDQIAQKLDANLSAEQPAQASVTQEQKQEAKKIKALKLKVFGQEVNEDLPFEIDDNPEAIEYLTKQLQMSKAAQRAMQEKGGLEKQIQSFFENLKGNTAQVLAQMGIDPIEFAAKQLEAEIEKQKLSPEERKNQELEARLRELEEENKTKEQEYRRKEFEAHRKQAADRIESQMIQALDKSDLPHTPYVADRIAKYMLLALNDPEGPVELTPEDVIPLVREEILGDMQNIIKSMTEDKLENFIGKDIFNKVRKKNIEKVKQVQTPATAKAAIKEIGKEQKASLQPKEMPKVKSRDFFGF